MPLPESNWLKVKQAAEYLQVHEKSIYRACVLNRIPYIKLPGIGIRIDKKKLDELLEQAGKTFIQ